LNTGAVSKEAAPLLLCGIFYVLRGFHLVHHGEDLIFGGDVDHSDGGEVDIHLDIAMPAGLIVIGLEQVIVLTRFLPTSREFRSA
jgi:hypothetical protein